MKIKLWILLASISWLIFAGCSIIPNEQDTNVWLANPASVYCEENGGTLEILNDQWWSVGICYFADWSFCEERDFYNWDCQAKSDENQEITTGENNQNITWRNGVIDFASCEAQWNLIMESYPRQCRSKDWQIFIEQIDSEENNLITWWNTDDKNNTWNMVACTMDAKQCPDGTRVGRIAPNCDFAPCPDTETNKSTQKDNKSISDIFEEHKQKDSYDEEWLTEDDIDLMEKIIERLK